MMRALVVLAGLLMIPTVLADPPAGSTCVSGYNPNALTNVCYGPTDAASVTVPWPGGSVDPNGGPRVCPVGQICVNAPSHQGGPMGEKEVGIPGALAPTYVTVLGSELYSSDGWEPIDAEWYCEANGMPYEGPIDDPDFNRWLVACLRDNVLQGV